jgi:tetratricopeptide (TPR) repeat protein
MIAAPVVATLARTVLCACLAATAGCSSFSLFSRDEATASQRAGELIAKADAKLAAGRSGDALELLREAREIEGLTTDEKNRIDLAVERSADARIRELSAPGSDPDDLEELFDLNLPRQLAITAGVRAAKLLLDDGEEVDAYQMIQKVDTRYPPAGTHHERVLAGDVLFEGGLRLSRSNFSFLGLFKDKDDAKAILEYLVQNYPQERRCDQAYRRLAKLYEGERLWAEALEKYQDLVTYHLDSPLAPESEWRIPHLRLVALRRPEYDRRELLRALGELDAWLLAHAGNEFEARARADRDDCARRLAESDLTVANFYSETDKWDGALIHAERALAYARQSGDERTVARAERALARVPEGTAKRALAAQRDEARARLQDAGEARQ